MSHADSNRCTSKDILGESNCSRCQRMLSRTVAPDKPPPGYKTLNRLHTIYPVAKESVTDANGNDIDLYLYHLGKPEPYTEALEHTISNIYQG